MTSRVPDGGEDWRPAASLQLLRLRAQLLRHARDWFAARQLLEVETPMLTRAAVSDSHIESFMTRYRGPGAASGLDLYLHTSPEYAMKRLLAAGSGAIYQICKVFRDGESGALHNPEFTMIEWYRPDYEHHAMMDEVEDLVACLLERNMPSERLTYADAFRRYLDLDPHHASLDELQACVHEHGLARTVGLNSTERDGWLELLLTHIIEPQLGRGGMCFIYDYPVSQAALARVHPHDAALAERFELYMEGVELANGYHELTDSAEMLRRFKRDAQRRQVTGREVSLDTRLLAAMHHGLPPCAGVALGFDRLVMLAAGCSSLDDVLAFPVGRA